MCFGWKVTDEMKGANGMKHFFTILKYMGFISMLFGLGAMDSASVALPIALIFSGLGAFYYGSHMESEYA